MFDVPGPRGFHDVFELRELRFPAKFIESLVRGATRFGKKISGASFGVRRHVAAF
jgi:hypothetical protein